MAVMKSLSQAKPLVIMTVGLPGAGKSYFARRFSETFNAPLVSYDRIRYELFNQPTYGKDEEAIVERIADYLVHELVKTGRTFIIDGGANVKADRYQISRAVRQHGFDTLLCWVQTDPATCEHRSIRRNPQKADDVYNVGISKDIFDSLKRRLTPPGAGENYAVISGKHTYSTQARMILRKLAAPRENGAINPRPRSTQPLERHINVQSEPETRTPEDHRRSININ